MTLKLSPFSSLICLISLRLVYTVEYESKGNLKEDLEMNGYVNYRITKEINDEIENIEFNCSCDSLQCERDNGKKIKEWDDYEYSEVPVQNKICFCILLGIIIAAFLIVTRIFLMCCEICIFGYEGSATQMLHYKKLHKKTIS